MAGATAEPLESQGLKATHQTNMNHKVIATSKQSPSTVSNQKSRPYRDVTKFARLILYSFTAPAFVYSTYIQLVTLKGPDRTPLPAAEGFGRDTVFLTFHGNILCTIYSLLCFFHSSLSMRPRWRNRRSSSAAQQGRGLLGVLEWATHRYSGPLFSLGFFVGAAYYLLIHWHPATRLRAIMVEDFDQVMALLHLLPFSFVIGDALLKNHDVWTKHNMGVRGDGRCITAYGCCYALWSYFCVYMNGGDWPYPFQRNLNVLQHCIFVGSVLVVSAYLTRFAHRIMGSFDRSSRLRWQARNAVCQFD